jgi:aryl-alcohol dehydrogenase-like predicted oxidoreductase
MTFGEQVDESTAQVILDRSLARGVDFIDTAEMYAVPTRAGTSCEASLKRLRTRQREPRHSGFALTAAGRQFGTWSMKRAVHS